MDASRSGAGADVLQLVTFHVGSEEFGVRILDVREINRMVDVTHVPHAPEFVEGVINLRGRVIPVVDLRKRFGLAVAERSKDNRIVVVDLADKVVGFVVDSVHEVLRIEGDVESPGELVVGEGGEYVEGIVKLDERLLILLDLTRLLTTREGAQLDGARPGCLTH